MQGIIRGSMARPFSGKWLSATALFATGALLIHSGTLRVRQAEAQTERETLASVSTRLALPPTASKHEIYTELDDYVSQRNLARRARIADLIGLDAGWDRIFQRIAQMEPSKRTTILQAMARIYGFSPDLSLDQIKKIVTVNGSIHAHATLQPVAVTAE